MTLDKALDAVIQPDNEFGTVGLRCSYEDCPWMFEWETDYRGMSLRRAVEYSSEHLVRDHGQLSD